MSAKTERLNQQTSDLIPFSYAGPCWFVVVTNPRCLLRAQLDLDAAGYRTFTPKTRKWVTHARVKKAVEKPILSRYLFVEVDYPRQSFGAVRMCNGVETILSHQGIPAAVPSRYVEDLLSRYLKGEWDEIEKDKLPLGARIRVMEGEFADMLATVTQIDGKKLSAKLFGKNNYQKFSAANVRAA